MSLPSNINSVFDTEEEVEDLITEITEINIDISDNDIDSILDATDGVGTLKMMRSNIKFKKQSIF